MLPPPVPPFAHTWGVFDMWGTLVRCDLPLVQAASGSTVRMVHDGLTWSIADNTATLLSFPTASVVSVEVQETWREKRSTPTWAIVLGIIGLLLFLIGALFFLVKETKRVPAAVVEVRLNDGRMVAFMPVQCDPTVLRTQLRR